MLAFVRRVLCHKHIAVCMESSLLLCLVTEATEVTGACVSPGPTCTAA